jgi:hypothetical protein
VLEGILIFWNSIVAIPEGILDKIQRLSFKYLWKGNTQGGGLSLANWKTIASPKEYGGWGLKDIRIFAHDMEGKNLWCLTESNSLWVQVICSKYMANLIIED